MQNQLNDTLIDVRKAYRLLFEYQDRIKNLVSFIGGHFDFEFREGHPIFSAQAKNGTKVKLDHWAWDWLSMYFYLFRFDEKIGIGLSIFILNDTGFYDAIREGKDAFELQPQTFNSSETSETKLFLVVTKNMWREDTELKEWHKIFFQGQNVFENNVGGKLIFKEYTLEQFIDESSAISSLEDFQAFCNQNDVTIQLKRRELQ